MTSSRTLSIIGVTVFLLALLVHLPADRIFILLRNENVENIVWQQVTGTVFHPRFHQAAILLPSGSRLQFEQVNADISIPLLLLGRLSMRFDLESSGQRISGKAILRRDSWQVTHIAGDLSVAAVLSMFPAIGPDGSDGRINMYGERLSGRYDGIADNGTLVLRVERLRPNFPGLIRPLGDYELVVNIRDRNIEGNINTLGVHPPLIIQGNLSLASGQLVIDGRAQAGTTADKTVHDLLPLFGVVENGIARIQWRARL